MPITSVAGRKDMKTHLKAAADKLVVINFSSTRCAPCQAIAPHYEKLSQVYSATATTFLHVDIEQDPENTAKFDVTVIPTFIFIKKLNVLDRYVGTDQYALEEKILKCQAIRVLSDTAVRNNKNSSSGDKRFNFFLGRKNSSSGSSTIAGEKPHSSDNSLSSGNGASSGSGVVRRSKSRLRRPCGC